MTSNLEMMGSMVLQLRFLCQYAGLQLTSLTQWEVTLVELRTLGIPCQLYYNINFAY